MKHFISSLSVINANTPPCKGRVSSRKILSLLLILFLGIGNAWAADSGITASDGVFVIDFYNSDKLSSTSGSDLSSTNCSTFVKVANGLTASNVVTSIAKDGTVQYNKNGGLTIGSSKANAHYVTFNIGSDYAVNKITVYATQYESGRLFLNGKAADSGNLGTKGCQFSSVTQPLVWDNLNGATTLKFTKDNGSGSNQKRLTIYTIVCEYTTSGGDEPVATLTATPTTIDFGTVYQGAEVESQTVAVNFANLTGNVTYSGLSTPFSATGAISATGDKITISADASTIGEYSQTFTIASTADSKTAEVTVKMNVVEKPAPTGTFTLHTGELIEGDYVIYYSGKAMKAEVASDRLQYVEVTPSNNEIVDPAAAAIWHIAKSGANWTVYNNNKGYAAGTGTKSEAGLVANLTGDNANKAAWTITASGNTYEFVNVWNTSKSVNATLRNNTTYGFACYSTSTGGALSLYRKAGTKYNVNISATTNGTVTASPTSAEAGTTITLTVTPETGYVLESLTVDGSAVELTDGSYTFNMPAANVIIAATFKENEKPAATLTLSKNGETEDITGHKQGDKVELPSITSDCVKEFVGWSADVNCATEPEYKEGEEYTLAETAQTLYAVYATVGGGGETTAANTLSSNGWVNESKHTSLQIDANVKATVAGKDNSGKYYNSGTDWRLYQSENATITISTTVGELKSVKFTFTNSSDGTLLYGSTKLTSGNAVEVSGTSATFSVSDTNEDENKGQIRFTAIEVVYTGGVSYSDYSTTCSAALANPTFSLTEGKYTEAKSIEIEYTEGTVYYTMDGTEPTASSTQYTGAIALNDCGEYTIKAIAISADSRSDVVSATYTIKLPLTNSQAAPYTETEAIAVYDGDCYDNQDVYVKGTVKTATFYSSSSTYTITLTNGFQFYKFYKDGSKATFTDGAINTGDVLVACGKLSKYNTTYQLAEGCYLVEHEPYTEPKTDISNTEATAYTVDKAFELIADVKSDLTKEVYVKGLVAVAPTSNPTADGQMTYSISDNGENTGNVLKVYLGLNLNGDKFTSKNDVQQGDYVVVKGKLLDYNSTYELNKGNQLVQHVKAATITIADITMEVGETKTIAATITPAAAKTEVAYSIKAGSDDCITLSENNITAKAEGTATIVATIATAADYMGKTVDFKVTVNAKSTKEKVVILAEYEGQWYALKGDKVDGKTIAALEVTYFDGKLYNVDDEAKALIEWERAVVDGNATFKNGENYLSAVNSTDLTLSTNACDWVYEEGIYKIESSDRTFLYRAAANGFKNYDKDNADTDDYSSLPVVTAPVYVNLNTASVKTVENAYFSVGNGEFVQFSTGNLQYEVGTNTWSFASKQYEVIGGEAYTGSNNTNYGMNVPGYTGKLDLFAWSCDDKYGVNPSNADADYTGGFADWGDLVSEAGWSTLTRAQMEYLLERKKDGKKLWGLATLEGKVALILLPDNWNTAIEFTYGYVPTKWNFTANELTKEDWNNLEANGAVLLPAGGSRAGGYGNKIGFDGETVETDATKLDANDDYFHVDNVGDYGYYWLSSTAGELADYLILPASDNTGANTYSPDVWSREKRRGNSVRLVKALKPDYERDVRQGYYGTICLPTAGQMVGASIFEIAYKDASKIYFDEIVSGKMEAGIPYIFLPNEGVTTLKVFYTEMAVVAAGSRNGLVGYYNNTDDMFNVPIGNYILLNNQYCEVVGMNAYIMQNYSYIVLDDVPDPDSAPAPAPGVRRISMGVNGQNTATGVDQVQGDNVPTKMIINGQLYILRGEKMYDAQGKLVK